VSYEPTSSSRRNKENLVEKFDFLVVDDHDFMRHIVRETLKAAGAGNIVTAPNGEEAITVLRKIKKIDFIVTDFNMPRFNGLEFLKAIRVGDAFVDRETPVIMLSGFDDETLLSTAVLLDAHGFITKPVSKMDLVERMNDIFMRESQVKSSEHYLKVQLPEIDGEFETPPNMLPVHMPKRVDPDIKDKGVSIPLSEVTPGALIVNDVVTEKGVTLVFEGHIATQQLIDFLSETQNITNVKALVVVPK